MTETERRAFGFRNPEDVEWRVVPGWPEFEVSEDGQLRRVRFGRHAPKEFRSAGVQYKRPRLASGTGYFYYQWTTAVEHRAVGAHVLVALAFLGSRPSPQHEVAHRDGSRTNNHHTNLRWATRAENVADTLAHGTRRWGEKINWAKLKEQDVVRMREMYATGRFTSDELAAFFNCNGRNVRRCVRGEQWAYAGGPIAPRVRQRKSAHVANP